MFFVTPRPAPRTETFARADLVITHTFLEEKNMKNVRIAAAALALAVATTGLAACSNSQKDSQTGSVDTATSAKMTATKSSSASETSDAMESDSMMSDEMSMSESMEPSSAMMMSSEAATN